MSALHSLAAAESSAQLGAPIGYCDTLERLSAIQAPDRELMIWQRSLPTALRGWLGQLDSDQLPNFRILIHPRDLRRAMVPLLDDAGLPDGEMREFLIQDIEALVGSYAGITGADLVDLRLEKVTGDACWKFHRDCVEKRMLTSYLGPSTQWVQPVHADQALQEQRSYEGPLEQLNPDDVAIFKGSRAADGTGILHRSPPISGTNQARLLLCLNQQSAASPVLWEDYSIGG